MHGQDQDRSSYKTTFCTKPRLIFLKKILISTKNLCQISEFFKRETLLISENLFVFFRFLPMYYGYHTGKHFMKVNRGQFRNGKVSSNYRNGAKAI